MDQRKQEFVTFFNLLLFTTYQYLISSLISKQVQFSKQMLPPKKHLTVEIQTYNKIYERAHKIDKKYQNYVCRDQELMLLILDYRQNFNQIPSKKKYKLMGSGATNNEITKLDMAEITYFKNQIQRMKFANQKDGFKNKTKETNNAIDLAMQRLRKDKLLDTNEMKNWSKLEKSKSKGKINNKMISENKYKNKKYENYRNQPAKYSPVNKRERTDLPLRSIPIVVSSQIPAVWTQDLKRKYQGQFKNKYLMRENKIKSQNKLHQFQSLNSNENMIVKENNRRLRKSEYQIP